MTEEFNKDNIKAKRIAISWNPSLPIFASESFLKTVGDEYGWLGGKINASGDLRCILPYTIIRKAIFRIVRFRVETIPMSEDFTIAEEKAFLNNAVEYFRNIGADMIMPAATNTIFRTYPDNALVAPYGSYIVDLNVSEDNLWRNVKKTYRQNINTAKRDGVYIHDDIRSNLDISYTLVRDTFKRSKLPFMNYDSFKRYIHSLGPNCKILVAYHNNIAQSVTVYAFSDYCAYAVYGGTVENIYQGAMKVIDWEAIRLFKNLGVRQFDFVGARINPEKGSKQETINDYKRRLGGVLRQGYIWKYSFRPMKYALYRLASHLRTGGDIVDYEQHKMKNDSV